MTALPPSLRFVDFFFQAGLPPHVNLLEKRISSQDDPPPTQDCSSSNGQPLDSDALHESLSNLPPSSASLANIPSTTPSASNRPSTVIPPQEASPRPSTSSLRPLALRISTENSSRPAFVRGESMDIGDNVLNSSRMPESGDKKPGLHLRISTTHSRVSTSSSYDSSSQMPQTPCAGRMRRKHPIEYQYQPEVLTRYPTTDYSDKEKFPQYLHMFCFPNEYMFKHDPEGAPPSTYHSFIITEETGAKSYGVCVTIYEKLHPNIQHQLEVLLDDWKSECIATSDIEYMQHIQSQLAANQETILKAKSGIHDPRFGDEDTAEIIAMAEEKVALFRELLRPMQATILVDAEHCYAPRTIGLISHWPWHDVFVDWLREMLRVVGGVYDDVSAMTSPWRAPLERCLINIVHEIPLPPPGRVELSISVGQLRLFCSRPAVNSIQALQNFPLYPLFRSLSPTNVLTLFELALAERKIIFLSSHISMLTLAAETLCLILYPLSWQHILIPVLPARLLSYLQAPMPYIVGVQRDYFGKEQEEEWRPTDATLVDLDNDNLDNPSPVPLLPSKDRRKLLTRLQKYTTPHNPSLPPLPHSPHTPVQQPAQKAKGVPLTVQYAFPCGKRVVRSGVSKRWLGVENEAAAAKVVAKMKSAESRRGSEYPNSTAAGGSKGERSGSVAGASGGGSGSAATSPLTAASFFSKLNKTFTNQLAVNTSFDSLGSSIADVLIPSTLTSSDRKSPEEDTPSSAEQGQGEHEGGGDYLEDRERDDRVPDYAVNFNKPSNSQGGERRRTRSANSDFSDPNNLPPLAPVVYSGDGPSSFYGGLPALESEASLQSFDPQTGNPIQPEETLPTAPAIPAKSNSIFGSLDLSRRPTKSSIHSVQSETPRGLQLVSTFFSSLTSTPQASSAPPTPSTTSASTIHGSTTSVGGVSQSSSTLPRAAALNPLRTRTVNQYTPSTHPNGVDPDSISMVSTSRMSSHRFSMYAPSIASSATTSPTQYESTANSPTGSGNLGPGVAVWKAEGHSFIEVSIIPEAVPLKEADSKVVGGSLGSLSEAGEKSGGVSSLFRSLGGKGGSAMGSRSLFKGESRDGLGSGSVGSSANELASSHSTMASVKKSSSNGHGAAQLVAGVVKGGDMSMKPAEGLCRLCFENLDSENGGVALRCESCNFTIHHSCLALVDAHPCLTLFNEKKVQGSFFKVFTSLFKSYRQYLTIPDEILEARNNSGYNGSANNIANIQDLELVQDDWFRKDEFLASLDRESRPFMTALVETQAFAQFTLDRVERPESDYEVLFFDESIKAKLNRSKLRFSKETTPFLKDGAYNVRATIQTLQPNMEGLDPKKRYSTQYFPLALDESLIVPARTVTPLVTEADQRMMRSHTNELVNRARMAQGMKRKQDFSKWMRTKLKHFQKIGGGEIVSIGFLSEEQRRELFEERLRAVSDVIDKYEAAHLSIQSTEEVKAAIEDLHAQHLILMQAAEEELVDVSDQDELQVIYNRLFRALTIYEDHHISSEIVTDPDAPKLNDAVPTPFTSQYDHPLKPIVSEVNKEILAIGVERKVKSVWNKVEKEISIHSLPTSVRSRSSSLRKEKSGKGKGVEKGISLTNVIVGRDEALKGTDKVSGRSRAATIGTNSLPSASLENNSKTRSKDRGLEALKEKESKEVLADIPVIVEPTTISLSGNAREGNLPSVSDNASRSSADLPPMPSPSSHKSLRSERPRSINTGHFSNALPSDGPLSARSTALFAKTEKILNQLKEQSGSAHSSNSNLTSPISAPPFSRSYSGTAMLPSPRKESLTESKSATETTKALPNTESPNSSRRSSKSKHSRKTGARENRSVSQPPPAFDIRSGMGVSARGASLKSEAGQNRTGQGEANAVVAEEIEEKCVEAEKELTVETKSVLPVDLLTVTPQQQPSSAPTSATSDASTLSAPPHDSVMSTPDQQKPIDAAPVPAQVEPFTSTIAVEDDDEDDDMPLEGLSKLVAATRAAMSSSLNSLDGSPSTQQGRKMSVKDENGSQVLTTTASNAGSAAVSTSSSPAWGPSRPTWP
ncbi:hypothetical protein HDV05_007249 [Chytridiales sp. JEL 0842]|nr:hypothetical protein HDV05_007249 [Chytridiales sp. JEL 0842]